MSKGSYGLAGGILGAVAGGTGIVWSILLVNFISELNIHRNTLMLAWNILAPDPYPSLKIYLTFAGLISRTTIPYPSNTLVLIFSAPLAILLFAFGAVVGLGFYKWFLKYEDFQVL